MVPGYFSVLAVPCPPEKNTPVVIAYQTYPQKVRHDHGRTRIERSGVVQLVLLLVCARLGGPDSAAQALAHRQFVQGIRFVLAIAEEIVNRPIKVQAASSFTMDFMLARHVHS
jgi:hypothetical protein